MSSIVSSSEKNYKYSIGYKDDDYKIKPLCLMLQKRSAYVKSYDGETKWKHFFIEHDKLLERYEVSNSIKKDLDCKTICN